MTDPTIKDPAELWVVLVDDGRPLYIYRYEERARDQAQESAGEHITCYVPKSGLSQAISMATQELRAHAATIEKRELAALAELDEAKSELELRDRRIAELEAERDKFATRIRGLEAGCEHRFDSDGDCMYCAMKDLRR